MVQFRAIDRRRAPQEVMRNFTQLTEQVQKAVYLEMAQDIATRSRDTEDTGTYAESHRVGQRSGSFAATKSSYGKPTGGTGGAASQRGLQAMQADIEALPLNAPNVVFRNEALHADRVESKGWPGKGAYRIYAQAQSAAPAIIRAVVQRFGLKTGGGA